MQAKDCLNVHLEDHLPDEVGCLAATAALPDGPNVRGALRHAAHGRYGRRQSDGGAQAGAEQCAPVAFASSGVLH